ncbi:Transcriptional regulator, GntR family OS=Tsukamurella paurometabola (strain ATCC 8368 / DSM/ CCUG 35730 / CIP 100753 / JCM 10117 / KCTC 9821 / NBRC 16120/ NCIMB 702349 / NCTC 13040) OX=521096 GN=Tpau_3518 PE=4 SV=1 [Tsukamurella paurometabola]|uniref:Transcriptional regulator, GntR family n=1 Tax=Tsukamurella paurometabola (strain ATCC 8368 / DSM 20162 / CCUG 35730 / CIP 100753 / JCM 10117 / KCTC 9821 / NBRC 16120 / NCIMB 702349 / NCTC 13040) TaxID=521096 RepID=D5UX78_TSUPD|nr:GntR family transcriptional regulator [Tsukamurella paurometabola]ADG80097.1 transcriptional regulator, GntR family [Tsukamurella paurometabola DSM 20162]SUP38407.1 transcriptional regulator NanR [Tsukamurella paurometabola]
MDTERRRGHAAARATDALRSAIVGGELLPGDRLREEPLAADLQVSRNTLREAMRILAHEGLIVHEANRGATVTVPTVESIRDLYRVRRTIEVYTLREADPAHPAADRMRAAVDAALAAAATKDWRAVGTCDLTFHRAIVALADSPRLDAVLQSLLAELRLAFGVVDDPQALHAPFLADNERILDLFAAGASDRAADELADYLGRSEAFLIGAQKERSLS